MVGAHDPGQLTRLTPPRQQPAWLSVHVDESASISAQNVTSTALSATINTTPAELFAEPDTPSENSNISLNSAKIYDAQFVEVRDALRRGS